MKRSLSVPITLWVNRLLFALIGVLIFLVPRLLDIYSRMRPLGGYARLSILLCFYCCVPVVAAALVCIEFLLKNIRKKEIFVASNLNHIRRIRLCCALVSLISLPASLYYMPLIFLVLIMAFLSLMVNVVCQVFKAAVALREENDLTI
jgi:hypothetical protein